MTILNSLKILDFSSLLPGPYATMMLADLGADVLRVESPTRPDLLRITPPKDGEDSAVHHYLNRSKRSITLNLKKPGSIALVKRLVEKYDIVLEQFRPGVMDRLGLSYEALKEVNPKLIYCSITGFGQTGPYRERPGHDINYLSLSGVASYSGRQDSGPPPLGIQVADIAGGSLHAVIGILTAVLYREQTGKGQAIDISMTDTAFSLNAIYGPGYLACGVEPHPETMMLNGDSFYDYYQTKDGRYFSVASIEPKFKELLCTAIGRPDLIANCMSEDPEDLHAFKAAIRDAFLTKTFAEWVAIFGEQQACVEPVLEFPEACRHPQLTAREMITEVPRSGGTTQRQIACPIKFSACKPQYKYIGGKVGADTLEILGELGLTSEEMEALKRQGTFS